MSQHVIVISGAVVLLGLAVTLFFLPARAEVSRSAIVPASPEVIYELLSTSAGFDRINPFRNRDAALAVAFSGPPSGVGASFLWSGKEGSGRQTISAVKPNEEVVMQLDLGQMGAPVQTLRLLPVAGGTQVTWSLEAEFGSNPLAKVFGLVMDGMLGGTYEQGLANLAAEARRS